MLHAVYTCTLPSCILAFAGTLRPPFSLEAMPEPSNARFNCVCIRHGFGQPHIVSSTTFFRHLQDASSEEERARIQAAKFDGVNNSTRRRAKGINVRSRRNGQGDVSSTRDGNTQVASRPRSVGFCLVSLELSVHDNVLEQSYGC